MDDRAYAEHIHAIRSLLIPPELQDLVQAHRLKPTRHQWVQISGPRLPGFESLTTLKKEIS